MVQSNLRYDESREPLVWEAAQSRVNHLATSNTRLAGRELIVSVSMEWDIRRRVWAHVGVVTSIPRTGGEAQFGYYQYDVTDELAQDTAMGVVAFCSLVGFAIAEGAIDALVHNPTSVAPVSVTIPLSAVPTEHSLDGLLAKVQPPDLQDSSVDPPVPRDWGPRTLRIRKP